MRARVERGQTILRAALLVAAVGLIGLLLYRQVVRMSTPRRVVWVAAQDLAPGQVVTASVLRATQTTDPPKGAFADRSGFEGRKLKVAKPAGQPFYPADVEPREALPALAATVPKGRLLASLRIDNMDLPAKELRAGDRLDIVAADRDKGVVVIAHDAEVLGAIVNAPEKKGDSGRIMGIDISIPGANDAPAASSALLLALRPADVLPVTSAEVSGTRVKVVLHSQTEVASGDLIQLLKPPTPRAPAASVEILKGSRREKVLAAEAVRPAARARVSPAPQPTKTPVKTAQVVAGSH